MDKELRKRLRNYSKIFIDAQEKGKKEADVVMYLFQFFQEVLGYNIFDEISKEYQIKARLQEQFDSDILRGQITVTTDSKEQPTIKVRYFGRMQKAGVRSPAPKPQAIQPSPAKQSGAPGAQTK